MDQLSGDAQCMFHREVVSYTHLIFRALNIGGSLVPLDHTGRTKHEYYYCPME
jgi:hypothetical protein